MYGNNPLKLISQPFRSKPGIKQVFLEILSKGFYKYSDNINNNINIIIILYYYNNN
jgi:hypothetical protein